LCDVQCSCVKVESSWWVWRLIDRNVNRKMKMRSYCPLKHAQARAQEGRLAKILIRTEEDCFSMTNLLRELLRLQSAFISRASCQNRKAFQRIKRVESSDDAIGSDCACLRPVSLSFVRRMTAARLSLLDHGHPFAVPQHITQTTHQ
jgi:hypothetical protein